MSISRVVRFQQWQLQKIINNQEATHEGLSSQIIMAAGRTPEEKKFSRCLAMLRKREVAAYHAAKRKNINW